MTKLFLLALSLFLSLLSFAAKTYQLHLKVHSMATGQLLEGIKISTSIKNKIVEIGITDIHGEILIKDLSEKSLEIIVEDPNNYHRKNSLFYSNYERVDEEERFGLRLNAIHEQTYFKELDSQYKDTFLIPTEHNLSNFVEANPIGGKAAFQMFLATNLEYPQDAIEKNITGKVYLTFIVQADGTLTHVKVERGLCPSLDKEAKRLLRYSGKWAAATLNEEPVPTKMRAPIHFNLN